jgi:hypothetical protein
MKKTLLSVCSAIVIIIIAIYLFNSAGSDYYNYKGYVTDIYENAKGETEIVALSGDVESHFVIKPYTKISAPTENPVAVGDLIMLTTTRSSDENIKKMKVQPGYSTSGRIFYVEEIDSPFILTVSAETGARYIANLVYPGDIVLPDITGSGDVIKVYHSTPLTESTVTLSVDAVVLVENGSIDDITAEDIEFIKSKGYSVRTK